MDILQKLWHNKQARTSMITAALAFVLMIAILIATFQVNAWFKSHHTVTTPAIISNFETIVEYGVSVQDGAVSTWHTLPVGSAIPLVYKDGAVYLNNVTSEDQSLQIRVTYKGVSAAYCRFSLSGSFRNAATETYLPQNGTLWNATGTNWIQSGEYWYYAKKLGDQHDPAKVVTDYKDTHVLDTFTVTLNTENLSKNISPHQDYQGELYVTVDAVQPDRVKAFWGINTIPTQTTGE